MDGELNNFIEVWTLAATALFYCYYIASRIPKGILRLISILPVIYLFITLPLHLTSVHFSIITSGFLVWLGNFKLILFCFDQGPLSPPPSNVFLFIALASLPIKLKQDQVNTKTVTTKNPPKHSIPGFFSFGFKALLLALLIYSVINYKNQIHPFVLSFLYGWSVYLELEIVLAISAVPARAILGVEIEPQFNKPYLSTSLQDLWSRRWNLMISSILRPTVYNPVRSISTPAFGSKWASLAAIIVTFSVSGLMHELLYYYLTRVSPTWEVTWFFVLHGVCVAAEVAVKRVVGDMWRLHSVVSGLLTIAFMAVTGHWLFLPQLIRNEVDEKVVGEFSILVKYFADQIHELTRSCLLARLSYI